MPRQTTAIASVAGLTSAACSRPRAGRLLIDALDPTIQRWYLPQELFTEYGRRQWQYTNYARDPFLRYVSRSQEGFYFYDPYGDLITRGWLIYDWRQTQPLTSASNQVTKRGEYLSWFKPPHHLLGYQRRLQLFDCSRGRAFYDADAPDFPQDGVQWRGD